MDECPVKDRIPIYLTVAGSVGLFSTCYRRGEKRNTSYTSTSETRYSGDTTYTLTHTRYHRDTSQGDGQQIFNLVNRFRGLMKLFPLAWFVAGNVWIYSNYEPNYTDPSSPDFCNKTLYLFAFWVTNSYYVFFGGRTSNHVINYGDKRLCHLSHAASCQPIKEHLPLLTS